MSTHPQAGQRADPEQLIDVDRLRAAYEDVHPDPSEASQRVAFGTSGHRGTSTDGSFNDDHVRAMTEAVVRHRRAHRIEGPLFLGRDTHALSEPAQATALEVLVAHGVPVVIDVADRYTPTPAISHAILTHNRPATDGPRHGRATADGPRHGRATADGIVVTPSHNPPEDGGFKYNPPHGGPADTEVTGAIEAEANRLLAGNLDEIPSVPHRKAVEEAEKRDYIATYVDDLDGVVDLEAIRGAGLRLGVDPLGGATVDYWAAIAERHGLDLTVVNTDSDPRFASMHRDHDGKLRMDCSSPHAMAGLIAMRDRYDLAFGNDPDGDRHGIVTPGSGLLNPNHYLATAIGYLFGADGPPARGWPARTAIGKTLVSSRMLDRVAEDAGRDLYEVPVGFKWFVDGLLDGWLGFGGEESAGASFLRMDGSPWATDKDGIILCLLAAEMTARTGRDPGAAYAALAARHGAPAYARVDEPATRDQKAVLKELSPDRVSATELAGDPITAVRTSAPGNDAPIGGLKVETAAGWFAARPSGTEDVYKVYAESFRGEDHLEQLLEAARGLVGDALG
ncbi:alpha-D-glucose phosphate-specific phosphoglucomutase [Egibacter rhizosphaerae]|uniref:Alpha-D-glucose phosphate-specific phosphoglucomutase n=1 Tax=Egibacter rhizosphaerae TaxID=1670831 RepID=A0A411YD10_9ACTN|nr:phosphoglucomutase (alpha-D-glucose-1,6-bisphosphate-dependent) [Egibacter rhizosphaerae]QBI19078.1 alpha-D-glucose phosphate-specific phosphoglucomutase [Egibacter rhizosphaerae]